VVAAQDEEVLRVLDLEGANESEERARRSEKREQEQEREQERRARERASAESERSKSLIVRRYTASTQRDTRERHERHPEMS
jgi:hypothetical protein